MHMSLCTCGCQRSILWSSFSLSKFGWIVEIKFRSSDLHRRHLYLMSHLSVLKTFCIFLPIVCPGCASFYLIFLKWYFYIFVENWMHLYNIVSSYPWLLFPSKFVWCPWPVCLNFIFSLSYPNVISASYMNVSVESCTWAWLTYEKWVPKGESVFYPQ